MVRLINNPCVLIIRDGWGENPHREFDACNAIRLARTPVADRLMQEFPWTLIATSGEDVGLTEGTMGNSEVGHQNIGAGRVVDQEAVRITRACRDGKMARIPAIRDAVSGAVQRGKSVHLLSIASDAGVHGQLEHLYATVRACRDLGATRIFVHLFTDGRDTGPRTGVGFIRECAGELTAIGAGRIVSVIGRYWAMDRDNRWERVARAYACLTGHQLARHGVRSAPDPASPIAAYYDNPMQPTMAGDEFVPPTMIGPDPTDHDETRITDGDAVIYVNYRGDRPRELVSAFVLPDFEDSGLLRPSPDTGKRGFDRGGKLSVDFVMMTPYSEMLAQHARVAFPKPPKMRMIAGEYFSGRGVSQFRCAETEKFPHVTFFFNDYREDPFESERREIIQSPKVSTYDLQPEMSAAGVAEAVLGRLATAWCEDVLVVNFANCDMVGHTGNLEATVRACEVVDEAVGRIVDAALARGGSCIVTADHGNAEQMRQADGTLNTAHTVYPVPLIVVGEAFRNRTLREGGRLADIIPTMIDMMSDPEEPKSVRLVQPPEMTGRSLLAPLS